MTIKRSMLHDVIHGVIHLDQNTFVADCLEVAVVMQGGTLDEVIKNLKDALALHLEGEDLAAFGLSSHPRLQLSFEPPGTGLQHPEDALNAVASERPWPTTAIAPPFWIRKELLDQLPLPVTRLHTDGYAKCTLTRVST